MFKLSSLCNHTSSKSLSPLYSGFVDDALMTKLSLKLINVGKVTKSYRVPGLTEHGVVSHHREGHYQHK